MRLRFLVVVVLVMALQSARTVHAGPVEQMTRLAFHPSNPDVMTIGYDWGGTGMLRTTDGGKSWQLACHALVVESVQNYVGPIAIAGDGTTFMGEYSGLWRDDGHACGWKVEPKLDGDWIGDVASDPSDPNTTYAVTSNASTDAQQKLNGLVRRDSSGTWSDLGVKQAMLMTRLVVAPHGSGLRFYLVAIKGQVAPPDAPDSGMLSPNYAVRVSDDQGQTWEEHVFGTTDGQFRIQGVDPKNPDRIVATINRTPQDNQASGADDDSVLVSSDRGAHFTEYMKVTEIGGVAFAPDGRVWVGDLGNPSKPDAPKGLWFAPSLDQKATKLAMGNFPVWCLAYQKTSDKLFACQRTSLGWVKQDDGTFNSLIKFDEVKDFVSCSGKDAAASCQTQLCGAWCGFGHFAAAPICQTYDTPTCGVTVAKTEAGSGGTTAAGTGGTGTAGSAPGSGSGGTTGSFLDAGASADAGKKTPAGKSGCTCTVLGKGASPRMAVLAGLVLSLLATRRRRRR
jgi:MYXO-CTERM domain-containing protein